MMTISALILAMPLSKLFVGYDRGLMEMTQHAFSIFAFSFIFTGLNFLASSYFTALNKGTVSAIISGMRLLVFQITMVIILPMIFGLDGIWWAVFVAETLSFILSLAFILGNRKKYGYL